MNLNNSIMTYAGLEERNMCKVEQELKEFVESHKGLEICTTEMSFPCGHYTHDRVLTYKLVGYFYPTDPIVYWNSVLFACYVPLVEADKSSNIFYWSEVTGSARGGLKHSYLNDFCVCFEDAFNTTDKVYLNSSFMTCVEKTLAWRAWDAHVNDKSVYSHKCPKCGRPAYVGFTSVDCSNPWCR